MTNMTKEKLKRDFFFIPEFSELYGHKMRVLMLCFNLCSLCCVFYQHVTGTFTRYDIGFKFIIYRPYYTR